MSIDFSNDDFKKNIHQFYKKVSQELKSKFDRNLSFQDAVFDRWERAKELNFGINTSIYNSSSVFGNVKVGENSWIGPNTLLDGTGGELIIGNNCSISSGVQIYTHDTVMWALSGGKSLPKKQSVYIGNNIFIGSQTIILLGSKIGDQSVIGANSLVNCNIPKRSIFAGTPAKQIGIVKILQNKIFLEYFNKD